MGLGSSRTRRRVTKVAPARGGGDRPVLPYISAPRGPEASEQERAPFPRQLPPLREPGHSRGAAGPRPLSLNTMLETEDTSIIKQHPPRRPQALTEMSLHALPSWTSHGGATGLAAGGSTLQMPSKLEPAVLLNTEKLSSQRDVAAIPKAKALERRGPALRQLPGRRQHLHKLQMLELTRRRREAELKRNLHREAKINKQKIKEFNPKKVLGNLQRGSSSESQDLIPAEPNQTFNGGGGNTWDKQFSEQRNSVESSPSRSNVDMWFCREQPTRDLFWDSSSTDSEDWEREGKTFYHRPTLVRTKTERIPLFDEFICDKDE